MLFPIIWNPDQTGFQQLYETAFTFRTSTIFFPDNTIIKREQNANLLTTEKRRYQL